VKATPRHSRCEDKLHDWMCRAPTAAERFGRLRTAQQAIAADWLTALEVTGAGGPR
jgi:hypothetical protein